MPFEQVREHLEALPWVQVSSSTVRRPTECVGEAALAVQTQQAKLLAACPQEEAGPYMAMSADGAYVPLMHGQWAEVKLVVIGEVERQAGEGAESEAHTGKLSYFARLAEIASFSDQVSSEVRRRGLEQAPVVVAVQDGAEWQQTLVQDYRHDAIRMLDCAHAAQRIAAIGEQVRERGQMVPAIWLEAHLHQLKHQGPSQVLSHLHELARLVQSCPQLSEHLQYLDKHQGQMAYSTFRRQGYPIGSGILESGNKLLMQARLKRAGMHWHPDHVNPVLALRMNLLNHRRDEGWQGPGPPARDPPPSPLLPAPSGQGAGPPGTSLARGSCRALFPSLPRCPSFGTNRGPEAVGTPDLFPAHARSRGLRKK